MKRLHIVFAAALMLAIAPTLHAQATAQDTGKAKSTAMKKSGRRKAGAKMEAQGAKMERKGEAMEKKGEMKAGEKMEQKGAAMVKKGERMEAGAMKKAGTKRAKTDTTKKD